MRKTRIILDALAESKKKVTYCAVDLARDSLIQVTHIIHLLTFSRLLLLLRRTQQSTLSVFGEPIMIPWTGLKRTFPLMSEKCISGLVLLLEISLAPKLLTL